MGRHYKCSLFLCLVLGCAADDSPTRTPDSSAVNGSSDGQSNHREPGDGGPGAMHGDLGSGVDRGYEGRDAGYAVADSSAGTADTSVPPDPNLGERLSVRSTEIMAGVARGVTSWRIWGRGPLGVAPVFTVPLANCQTLVGFTTSTRDDGIVARVIRLNAQDELESQFELGRGVWLRGLAAEPDGHFGALLWDDRADSIRVSRFDAEGAAGWTTELINADNRPTDFDIGDSRLAYGGGRYGAYYHVHSNTGHEGDTLKWVDANSGSERTGWTWGCSHSMSNILRYHPGEGIEAFLPVCVTDCYPGTSGDFNTQSQGGIYINHRGAKVMDVDAGCNGAVAAELGGAALGPNGWALVFNAHQAPMTPGQQGYNRNEKNQDIGFSAIGANRQPGPVVWLTTTELDEADASIAAWTPRNSTVEQYIVGWSESGGRHQLARIDGQGTILEGPHDVSDRARWGKRDDPFRQHVNGDVVWAWFEQAGQTTLKFARLSSGGMCP